MADDLHVADDAAPALLEAQFAVHRRLFVGCLVAFVPVAVFFFLSPTTPPLSGPMFAGGVGTLAIVALSMRRHRRFMALGFAAGIACAIVTALVHSREPTTLVGAVGFGWLLALALWRLRATDRQRRSTARIVLVGVLMPAFFVTGVGWTVLTSRLLPEVLDAFVYYGDATLPLNSFHVGRWFAAFPILRAIAGPIYEFQWGILLLLWMRQLVDENPKRDLLETAFVGTLVGVSIYYVFPVVGPLYAFADVWPRHLPSADAVRLLPAIGPPEFRNCVPSMHNAWAILCVWHARDYERPIRVGSWLLLVITALATLGFGYHYVLDIVVAWPAALLIQALTTRPPRSRRVLAIAIGGGLVFGWLVVIRYGATAFAWVPGLACVPIIATVVVVVIAEAKLLRHVEIERAAVVLRERTTTPAWWLASSLFLLSGFTGLVYEVTFSKALGLTFGNTSAALTTVLATYMGGMAVGSWLGGRIATRTRFPLRLYGYCEGLTAALCFTGPWQLELLRRVYVSVAAGTDPGKASLALLRMALEACVLLPPTILMGMTLPILFSYVEPRGVDRSSALARLYGANTFGAALGALTTGFVLLPKLGVRDSILVAVAGNLLVTLVAVLSGPRPRGTDAETIETSVPSKAGQDPSPRLGYASLALSGFLTLALETVYEHLLAVVVGTSAYAFSVMLFAFLVGLSGGSTILGAVQRRRGAIAGSWSPSSRPPSGSVSSPRRTSGRRSRRTSPPSRRTATDVPSESVKPFACSPASSSRYLRRFASEGSTRWECRSRWGTALVGRSAWASRVRSTRWETSWARSDAACSSRNSDRFARSTSS